MAKGFQTFVHWVHIANDINESPYDINIANNAERNRYWSPSSYINNSNLKIIKYQHKLVI